MRKNTIVMSNDLFKIVKSSFGYELIQTLEGGEEFSINCFTTLENAQIEFFKLCSKYRTELTRILKTKIYAALKAQKTEYVKVDGASYCEYDLFEEFLY